MLRARVVANSLLGFGILPVIPTWMMFLGTPMSFGLFMMVRWHATHHVAGISVIPGLADQIVLTTHTMTGAACADRLLLLLCSALRRDSAMVLVTQA